MEIAIIGIGMVGEYLLETLKGVGKVTVIDNDQGRCDRIAELYSKVDVINGDAEDHNLLDAWKISKKDFIFVTTGNTATNILTSMYLKNLNAKKVICRLDSDKYVSILNRMGIIAVSDNKIMAKGMLVSAFNPVTSVLLSWDKEYHILDVKGKKYKGKRISDLLTNRHVHPIAIYRNGMFILPKGDDRILEDDILVMIKKK